MSKEDQNNDQKRDSIISAIAESVYHEPSFDNTAQHLYEITEHESEEETRVGSRAYQKYY